MLSDIGDAHVGMLPDNAVLGLQLARQRLDHGGLAGAIGTNDCDAAVKGALDRDIRDDVLDHARVPAGRHKADVLDFGHRRIFVLAKAPWHAPDADLGHLQDGAVLGLDALEEAGLGQHELDRGGRKLIVGAGLRLLLDKLGQVALVATQLEVLVMDDARAHIVEEARVVRHNHAGHIWQVRQVVLQPCHVLDILHEFVGTLN